MFSSKNEEFKIEKIAYEKDKIEHLIDQLITLQCACDQAVDSKSKEKLVNAMETVNKSLHYTLNPNYVITSKY